MDDATRDGRLGDSPLVTGAPGIRFYAAVPLWVDSGYCLGTLCVIDTVPRELTPEQLKKRAILARHVAYKLDFRLQDLKLKEDLARVKNTRKSA